MSWKEKLTREQMIRFMYAIVGALVGGAFTEIARAIG